MEYFDLEHGAHTYRIHCRPPRKTNRRLRLSIDPQGGIHLSRPLRTPLREAQAFARAHLDWLEQRAVPLALQNRDPYADGSAHYLLGERHTLQLGGSDNTLRQKDKTLYTAAAPPHILAARFKTLHRAMSAAHIPALVQEQLPHCRWVATVPPIRYRVMRKTWGTCRHDGILTFNTRLIQYPRELIEHVILHELCHLAVFDHSPAFYDLMQRAQPDWRERRQALSDFARQLPV